MKVSYALDQTELEEMIKQNTRTIDKDVTFKWSSTGSNPAKVSVELTWAIVKVKADEVTISSVNEGNTPGDSDNV